MEIKGPFSYSGNKFKIYKKHLHNITAKYDYIIELFGGSSPILYNSKHGGFMSDTDSVVCFLHTSLKNDDLLNRIKKTYGYYFPNGRDRDGYLKLRKDFNEIYTKNGLIDYIDTHLHLLIQLSFNSLIRFGPNGYNVPFGRKEVDFKRIENHINIFNNKSIDIFNVSYVDAPISDYIDKKTLVYIDPPYVASNYQYSDGWTDEDEYNLLNYIDKLSEKFDFVLSNTFYHRGKINKQLIDWSEKYKIKTIQKNYNSWTAAVESVKTEKSTVEVLISNIHLEPTTILTLW